MEQINEQMEKKTTFDKTVNQTIGGLGLALEICALGPGLENRGGQSWSWSCTLVLFRCE